MRTGHVLGVLALAGLVVTPLVVGRGSPARQPAGTEDVAPLQTTQRRPDAENARALLESMRGAAPVPCEMAVHTLDLHFGWRDPGRAPDVDQAAEELVQWATRRIEDSDAVPVLQAGLRDPDTCVRRVAARLLGRTRVPEALAGLLDALGSSDAAQREAAAVGLGHSERGETVPQLVRVLDDDSPTVRAAVAWALGNIESRDAVQPLVHVLQTDTDPRVRRAAAWALGEIH